MRAACIRISATFRTTPLKDHPKVVTLPHLGASTGEAEENCAVMVAEQVRDFLENGKYPQQRQLPGKRDAARPQYDAHRHRQQQRPPTWSVRSQPASPGARINIADLLNKSRGEYAYTLIDTDGTAGEEILNKIRGIDGVLSARIV